MYWPGTVGVCYQMMAENDDNSECTVSQGWGIVSSVSGN